MLSYKSDCSGLVVSSKFLLTSLSFEESQITHTQGFYMESLACFGTLVLKKSKMVVQKLSEDRWQTDCSQTSIRERPVKLKTEGMLQCDT